MPPLPRDNFAIIDDDVELTLVGSVEVISDGDGTVHLIKCLPPDDFDEGTEVERFRVGSGVIDRGESVSDEDAEQEEDESVEYGLLEAISMVCAHDCSCHCAPYSTKSILKTSKSRNPNEAAPAQHHQVSFSQNEIREFDITLGHHPSAVYGPPIMLDYDSEATNRIVDVDEYERERGEPRTRKQLKINFQDRKQILLKEKGFSEEEVNRAWAEAITIRKQRRETLNRGLLLMMMDDFTESLSRKYNRMLESVGLL
jgi:hypothetical protein